MYYLIKEENIEPISQKSDDLVFNAFLISGALFLGGLCVLIASIFIEPNHVIFGIPTNYLFLGTSAKLFFSSFLGYFFSKYKKSKFDKQIEKWTKESQKLNVVMKNGSLTTEKDNISSALSSSILNQRFIKEHLENLGKIDSCIIYILHPGVHEYLIKI